MMCNNTAIISFGEDLKFHRKAHHITRHYHFVRDAIKGKEVTNKYISTSRMIANSLTKPIFIYAFKAHVVSLGLHIV